MYTTRLLTIINDRMPRRHQAILAVLVVFLTLASIAGSRPAERPVLVVQPAIILVATPTSAPTGASRLAKEAGRVEPVLALSVPTAAPTAAPLPTAEPEPVIIVVVAQPTMEPSPTVEPLPSPTGPTGWPPRWTIR